MATDNRKRFSSVEALKKFTPECLTTFLKEFPAYLQKEGVKLPTASDDDMPYPKLVDLFMNKNGHAPAAFLNAIFYINALATEAGMAQIKAQAKRDSTTINAPNACTCHDFAFYAWLADKNELLPRSLARSSGRRKRSAVTFQTEVFPVPDWTKTLSKRKPAFQSEMDQHFDENHQGVGTVLNPYPEGDEDWFLVRRGGGHVRFGVIKPDRKSESDMVACTPELYDAAVYNRELGEIRIYAPTRDREAYRQAFGRLLGGSPDLFVHSGLFTLDPLNTGMPNAIEIDKFADRIRWLNLVELEYEMPGNGREYIIHRAPNLYSTVRADHPLIPAGAKPLCATFSVMFNDSRTPRTLTIIPPNIARYTRDDDAPVVEAWMREQKFKLSLRGGGK